MTEQFPEIVATAELSPVSPRPVHISSPLLVPALQEHADTLDVVSLDKLAAARKPSSSTMAVDNEPAADTIVVAGSSPDGSHAESVADDDSFDAYGEDDDTQQQQTTDPDAGIDDYAKTFDSPPPDDAQETQDSPAATNAPEPMSMSIVPTPEPLPNQSQSPVAPTSGVASTSHPSSTAKSPQPTAAATAAAVAAVRSSSEASSSSSSSSPSSSSAQGLLPPQPSKLEDEPREDDASTAIDIEKLVDDLTARAAAPEHAHVSDEPASTIPSQPPPGAPGLAQPSSLPPKPTMTQDAAHMNSIPADWHHSQSGGNAGFGAPPVSAGGPPPASFHVLPGQPSASTAPGAPGNPSDAMHKLPPPPAAYPGAPASTSYSHAQALSDPKSFPQHDVQYNNAQQAYDAFLEDERKFMLEAKWERFPDGSRIFIGNLSQERVSKKDVFDLFHKYGRLAQISLKSAYGFVQYHTVADAQAAMENLQGAEVRGRRIHLEISRTQKKDKDRDRSPDRRQRGRDRGTDRYDGRERRGRDEWRGDSDNAGGRRNGDRFRDGRDQNSHDSFDRTRNRSRSPNRHGRRDTDSYRRRSPSPYGRSRSDGDGLDIPRRYGADVPDVQILLTEEVQRDFVDWVQRAFNDRQLKTDVMFLNPRFPRDALIQRQALEGVHGVVDLNIRAQSLGKIPLQVFDRAGGGSNVRFDSYQDLEPHMAAEVVLRARTSAPPAQPAQPAYPSGPTPYGHPYGAVGQGYAQAYPNPAAPAALPAMPAGIPDLSGIMSQIDNATLQKVLAALHPSGQGASPPNLAYATPTGQPMGMPNAANTQADVNALLSNLRSAAGGPTAPPAGNLYGYPAPGGHNMMPPGAAGNAAGPGGGPESAQAVQSIMAQLAKFRQ